MSISAIYNDLLSIAREEYGDIVAHAEIIRLSTGVPRKLRLRIVDNSFVDIFVSLTGRYSYHWGRNIEGKGEIYRHDNAPHKAWQHNITVWGM